MEEEKVGRADGVSRCCFFLRCPSRVGRDKVSSSSILRNRRNHLDALEIGPGDERAVVYPDDRARGDVEEQERGARGRRGAGFVGRERDRVGEMRRLRRRRHCKSTRALFSLVALLCFDLLIFLLDQRFKTIELDGLG